MASMMHRVSEQLVSFPVWTIGVKSEIVQFYLLVFVLFSTDLL